MVDGKWEKVEAAVQNHEVDHVEAKCGNHKGKRCSIDPYDRYQQIVE